MRALTTIPRQPDTAELQELPEPQVPDGWLLVETLAIGVCGTDREILDGSYGEAPPGRQRLVLGHECLARVRNAPAGSGFATGDLVTPIVRRPDPVPCAACHAGQWDMCANGRYTEHGIRGLDGFARERFALEPAFAVKVDPGLGTAGVLVEPASVVAKAWEHVQRIGARAVWEPRKVLITGAGPVGLLAALLAVQLGFDVHVLDRVTAGPKPQLVRDLGATYHSGDVGAAGDGADVVIECTGASAVVLGVLEVTRRAGIVCLTGLSSGSRTVAVDLDLLNRRMVLENDVLFGSVNANRAHYVAAASALARADRGWLARLITSQATLADWRHALAGESDGVKAIIDFQ